MLEDEVQGTTGETIGVVREESTGREERKEGDVEDKWEVDDDVEGNVSSTIIFRLSFPNESGSD
jgi:hypothetical protein